MLKLDEYKYCLLYTSTDALLKNAPDTDDGYIRVPAIIDESEDGE